MRLNLLFKGALANEFTRSMEGAVPPSVSQTSGSSPTASSAKGSTLNAASEFWSRPRVFSPGTIIAGIAGSALGYSFFKYDVPVLMANPSNRLLGIISGLSIGVWLRLYIVDEDEKKQSKKALDTKEKLLRLVPAKHRQWESFCQGFSSNFAWSHAHKKEWKDRYRFALSALFVCCAYAKYPFEKTEVALVRFQDMAKWVGIPFGLASFFYSLAVYHAYNNGLNGLYAVKLHAELAPDPIADLPKLTEQFENALNKQNENFQSALSELRNLWKLHP